MQLVEVLAPLLPITVIGSLVYLGVRSFRAPAKPPVGLAPVMHCMTCGEDSQRPANTAAVKRGNATLEIVLWVFLLWPIALVYSVWRRIGQGAKATCPVCNAATLVPATSPAARAHRRQLYPDTV